MIKLIDALRLCDKITFDGYEMLNFWPRGGCAPVVDVVIEDSDEGGEFTVAFDGSQIITPDETGCCEIEDMTGAALTLELMVYVPFGRHHIPEELLT